MTAREVQPTPPSTPTAALRLELADQLLGFVVSQAIYVAATLGIADQLAEGPRSATDLAVAAGADPDRLYRLLRLLAGHGIFVELPGGQFVNSARSQLLREGPGSLRALAMSVGENAYPAMGATQRMVQTGQPAFELVFEAVWEEHLARNPVASKRFNHLAAARAKAVAEVLAVRPWHGAETVVGVGAGSGALVQGLLERCPDLHGVISTSRTWSLARPDRSRPRAWPVAARRWPGASSKVSPRAATSTSWPMSCTAGTTPTPGRSLGRSAG
jgi:Dimerisation domain